MTTWHLLILTLPTGNAPARMRVWRALKAVGAAVLRDGVYLLPAGGERRERLAAVARDVEEAGGTAYLLDLADAAGYPLPGLFDRGRDYDRLLHALAAWREASAAPAARAADRELRRLRREFEAIVATDFFPGEAQGQAAARLAEAEAVLRTWLAPDEPTPGQASPARRDPAEYRGRRWATRRDLWVDRLASAWLIRRCIDPQARFLWLVSPADCPSDALGFDFDGAAFSHGATPAGERVSFETLLAAFGLEDDPALVRLGRLVHCLDVGGLPVPEAAGVESLLRGMKSRIDDDDALLAEAGRLFDDLRLAFHDKEKHA